MSFTPLESKTLVLWACYLRRGDRRRRQALREEAAARAGENPADQPNVDEVCFDYNINSPYTQISE